MPEEPPQGFIVLPLLSLRGGSLAFVCPQASNHATLTPT